MLCLSGFELYSCWVPLIEHLGVSFGSIFLPIPLKVARAHANNNLGKSPVATP